MEGSTKKSESYEDAVKYAEDPLDKKNKIDSFTDLIYHKDFDIKDPSAQKAFFSSFNRLPDNHFYIFSYLDEKKLGDLFDATPSLEIEEGEKKLSEKRNFKTIMV